jgi:nicotinamide-nucleotide amidase
MKVGLITIGAELLNGTRTDTNASWIGQSIVTIGADINWHMTVNDSDESILNSLNQIPSDVKIVLCTGGLGPTHDDITASVLYKYFNDKPLFDEKYWSLLIDKFKDRGIQIPEANKNQAIKPKIGKIIPNPIGSARGLHFKNNNFQLFSMPGVPSEMKAMMNDYILPIISEMSQTENYVKLIRTTGIMESALYEIMEPYLKNNNDVNVAFLPRFTGVDLRISSNKNEALVEFLDQILDLLDKYYYADDDIELEDVLGQVIIHNKKTISTAESCTGGLISDRLTNTPNSSSYFKGGVVAYSNSIKIKLLNVNKDTINKNGAVSKEVALEMAQGIRKNLNVDIGLSTTGIAGPGGGSKEKPIGLVYIGISASNFDKVYKFNFTNNRKTNKLMTSQAALNILRNYLKQ